MKATLLDCTRLTTTTHHHAFTTLCRWNGDYYCAYRVAATHNILPPGHLVVQRRPVVPARAAWEETTAFHHPTGDLRDPRFFATPEVLYLLCGAYLPHPALRTGGDTLAPSSSDNMLQTHGAYTTDGTTWSALVPILRPNYWGWSAVAVRGSVALAAYHTGTHQEPSSIAFGLGRSLPGPLPLTTIYDGASGEREGAVLRYPALSPSEPVLWYDPATTFLGCAVRTEGALLTLGAGKWPYGAADWRWHLTHVLCHPSAVLQTPQGLLLAGRQLTRQRQRKGAQTARYTTTTALYEIAGHAVTPLLTLESSGDTGYAGAALGEDEDTIMLSFYSQHEVPRELPGAAVYVATVALED